MTAFLKIDRCKVCGKEKSREWIPEIAVDGRRIEGTGLWQSQLFSGVCLGCRAPVASLDPKD
jgi:hypothetical protein